ncbi:MAG: tetratricopeptide repeat protein, partial [Bauldia sp.]
HLQDATPLTLGQEISGWAAQLAHGEALTAAAGGAITPEAKAAFDRALTLEPKNLRARFLMAAALAQEGSRDEAVAAFSAILVDLPEASPWRPTITQALADLGGTPPPGPTAEEIDAAGLISDKDRAEMIGEMVSGLDRRLRENPDDPEGWQRLVRSYVVLERPDEAADALARGIDALGRGSEAAAELQAFAAGLGVEAKE